MIKKVIIALFALVFSSVAFAQHDQYGEWAWPSMDGIPNPVWLKAIGSDRHSNNSTPTTLYLEFDGNTSLMCFFLEEQASPETIDWDKGANLPIVEMEFSFDNGDFNYFKFIRNPDFWDAVKEGYQGTTGYQFVSADRFKGATNYNATSMLKQMSNKRKLKIRYKVKDGSSHTETFKLEGLEAILEVIFE